MDDHLEEAVEIKPKVKAAPPPPVAKKVVPASRPVAKASTSSGTGKLKTQAETAKQVSTQSCNYLLKRKSALFT